MAINSDVSARLTQAAGLPELLDAAYEAFEEILALLRQHDDPGSGLLIPMVIAAASAANGRDYIGWAPSLPQIPLRRIPPGEKPMSPSAGQEAADWIASLCQALAAALTTAGSSALAPGDRRACADAVLCALEIGALMGGQT